MFNVTVTAEIEKAFLNVEVDENDRDYFRFVWPENPQVVNSDIMVYRFCREVFGLNALLFLLYGTMCYHFGKY